MVVSVDSFREFIDQRFAGKLVSGLHAPNSMACALEAYSQALGGIWTSNPRLLHIPDLRPLNDALWSSDAARTEAMIPLVATLAVWATWPKKRRERWLRTVIIKTVQQIISVLPDLPATVVRRCQSVKTLKAAEAAARAAAEAEARAEARAAAWAAEAGAGDKVLTQACRIWIEAAR